jgi:hypothetical protein
MHANQALAAACTRRPFISCRLWARRVDAALITVNVCLSSSVCWRPFKSAGFCVARFCTIEPHAPHRHHDAIAFPDGNTVLGNLLSKGSMHEYFNCLLSGRNGTSKPVLRKL